MHLVLRTLARSRGAAGHKAGDLRRPAQSLDFCTQPSDGHVVSRDGHEAAAAARRPVLHLPPQIGELFTYRRQVLRSPCGEPGGGLQLTPDSLQRRLLRLEPEFFAEHSLQGALPRQRLPAPRGPEIGLAEPGL